MIYRVNEKYIGSDNFFIKGEVFEGVVSPAGSIYSTSKTGKTKRNGYGISAKVVTKIAETWKEAREKYPEEFL